jgi:hypothetical protein
MGALMCCSEESLRWLFDARPDGMQVRLYHLPTRSVVSATQEEGESIMALKARALSALTKLLNGESQNP